VVYGPSWHRAYMAWIARAFSVRYHRGRLLGSVPEASPEGPSCRDRPHQVHGTFFLVHCTLEGLVKPRWVAPQSMP
jgi:hypothetical protein